MPQAVEQCALAAVAPLESMRFLVEMDTWSDISEKTNEEQPNDGRVGEKVSIVISSVCCHVLLFCLVFTWLYVIAEA